MSLEIDPSPFEREPIRRIRVHDRSDLARQAWTAPTELLEIEGLHTQTVGSVGPSLSLDVQELAERARVGDILRLADGQLFLRAVSDGSLGKPTAASEVRHTISIRSERRGSSKPWTSLSIDP